MTYSLDWDLFYDAARGPAGGYPNFEKLVAFFVRDADRMLELGAGAGAEIPFFSSVGFGYHGIDGSEAAIAELKKRFPSIADRLAVGDFTKALPFDGQFDLIVDRASVPHNDLAAIKSCVSLVHAALKPGGLFLSSDWFSTKHSEAGRGVKLEDGTRTIYPDGQFQGVGNVHFSSEAELIEIFKDFEGIFMQERTARRPAANSLIPHPVQFRWVSSSFAEYQSAWWDIVVRKPL